MEKYFLHDGQNQLGPFSSEELKVKNITCDTHIWKDGLSDWVKASEIPELKYLFTNTPPPFKRSQPTQPPKTATTNDTANNEKIAFSKTAIVRKLIRRNPKFFLLIFVAILFIGFAFYSKFSSYGNSAYSIGNTNTQDKTPEELRTELKNKEQQSPEYYLTDNITMRSNLLGEKVFEGTITNKASTAIFKDIIIVISFISKTQSVINEQQFTIYELINPKQTIRIKKIKTFAPSGTEAFLTRIISATPAE